MKVRGIILVLAIALVAPTSIFAATSLAVTPNAAIEGNYGLEITFDGSTTNAYVQDDTPTDESVYRVIFWIDRSGNVSPGVAMDNCGGTCVNSHGAFLAREDTAGTAYRVLFRRTAADDGGGNPRYTLRVSVRDDANNFAYAGGVVIPIGSQRKQVMIEWAASSAPGANDGHITMWTRNLTSDPWSVKANLTGIDNDTWNVDYCRLGATQAVDATTTGAVLFDSFESYRTLAP
jgi:hypothetical protein